jgi:hypothetical protein
MNEELLTKTKRIKELELENAKLRANPLYFINPTKPEPSRLEIAAMFAVADYSVFAARAQDGGPTIDEFYPWPNDFRGCLEAADALIAAAKAVQP